MDTAPNTGRRTLAKGLKDELGNDQAVADVAHARRDRDCGSARIARINAVERVVGPNSELGLYRHRCWPWRWALWFTSGGGVGRLSTAGVFTDYPVPDFMQAFGSTIGPDGAVWFAGCCKIERLDPLAAPHPQR